MVFVLPVVFSIIFGSTVMADILQNPDRQLRMWPESIGEGSSHGSSLEIIGLLNQYSASEPVEIQVVVSDAFFSCGDLYVTIYSAGQAVAQGGYFEQCFEGTEGILPVDGEFSKEVTAPGSYRIVAEMVSKQLEVISADETFTVK